MLAGDFQVLDVLLDWFAILTIDYSFYIRGVIVNFLISHVQKIKHSNSKPLKTFNLSFKLSNISILNKKSCKPETLSFPTESTLNEQTLERPSN